jgi:hypothetical protein
MGNTAGGRMKAAGATPEVPGTSQPGLGIECQRCEAAKETLMRRFLLAAVALTLVVATAARAESGSHGHRGSQPSGYHNSRPNHGGTVQRPAHGGGAPGGHRAHPPASLPHPAHARKGAHESRKGGEVHPGHTGGRIHPPSHRNERPNGAGRFGGGLRYLGREHRHWTHRYWWARYGCYTYYCPDTRCWYYWYEPDDCYYPCSYIDTVTPAAQPAPAGLAPGVTVIINVTTTSGTPQPPGP